MTLRSAIAKMTLSVLGSDVFSNILASNAMSAPPRLGTRQLLRAYSTMPWLRACVQKTSWSVATNRWQLFVAQRGSKAIRDDIMAKSHDTKSRHALIQRALRTHDMREITQNAFLDFLSMGTPPFFNGLQAAQLTNIYHDLVGESLWVLERKSIGGKGNRGTPHSIWVIPPSWVQSTPTIGHPFFHIVGPQGSRHVPAEDCVWWYQPDPVNPYSRGTGTGHVLGDELETDEYAAKYTKAFFYNDARPPFVVSIDGADKTEVDRVSSWWQTKHQGFGRWWKPGFIGKKLDIHEFGNTFKDMDMVPLRKFERDTILQVYGNPPEIFGITESSNRATADAAKAIYAEHVVVPRLEFKRAGLQQVAETEFDERLIVEFENPIPEDKEFKLKAMTAVPHNFRVDEHRIAAGLPELEDGSGQVHMVPFTVTPKKRIDEPDEPPAPAPSRTPLATEDDDDEEDEPPKKPKPEEDDDKDPRRLYLKDGLKPSDLQRVVARITTRQMAKHMEPVIRSTIENFGQSAIDEVVDSDLVFNMRDREVANFLKTYAGDRITDKINKTTMKELRTSLSAGVDAGESLAQLTARVKNVFKERNAAAIARTEVARASNFASLKGMKQAGIEQKEWLSTQDERTRDTHGELDGTRVGVDEVFESSSGHTAQYPGEFGDGAEDINCRCTVVSVFEKSARVTHWKGVEAERRPFDRQMKRAVRQGFADQEAAVLDALNAMADDAAA